MEVVGGGNRVMVYIAATMDLGIESQAPGTRTSPEVDKGRILSRASSV